MAKGELQNVWLALRATGLSYRKIAKRIGVSRITQAKWEAKFKDKLESLKSGELEFINDQLRLAKKHRLERLSGQLERLEDELDRRDISDIPTASLLRIFTSLVKAIQNEIEKNSSHDPEIDESMIPYLKIISRCGEFKEEKK